MRAMMLKKTKRTVISPLSESAAWNCIHAAVDESVVEIMLSELQFVNLQSMMAADPITYPNH
jgi:hypothetical protein